MYWKQNTLLNNGQYLIMRDDPLGLGGFGITHLAKNQVNGRLIAIKTLNQRIRDKSNFEEYQEKFVREAFALAKCRHPHVVEVLDVFREDGIWCMAMDYIEGQSLQDYRQARDSFSETEALTYIRQIGTALDYVHQQGLLHRDVKPLNILIRQELQQAILIDFGLAREFDQGKTKTHTSALSEGFAPIEQYEQRAQRGAYCDVYALAATFYWLLTNKVPMPSEIRRDYGTPLKSPLEFNPSLSERTVTAIVQGMALEPQDRPQTMGAWLGLLGGQVIEIPTATATVTREPMRQDVTATVTRERSPIQYGRGGIELRKFSFETAKVTIFPVGTAGETDVKIALSRGEAEYFEEDLGKGIKLEMVKIPKGSFWMGSPASEEDSSYYERPQAKVQLSEFYMGKYLITQAQWQAIMGDNPSSFKNGDRHPVDSVSWHDCQEFLAKLNQRTKRAYRLPSEAEWEYACRAGTETPFYCGETLTTDVANYSGEYTYGRGKKGIYRQKTTEVGTFPANPFGLYDMHGNLWEWCGDDYHYNYNLPRTQEYYKDTTSEHKVFRGGSWLDNPGGCRSAPRCWADPARSYDNGGFRVVCGRG